MSLVEYKQVVDEAIPALGFYSNIPSTRSANYFDISSKLFFFLHTWSLSVEMQFYLTVPLFFILFQFLYNFRPVFKFLLIGSIPLASFLYQTYYSTGNSSHMLLTARLWQFFAGFGAHYVYENRWLNFNKNEENEESNKYQLMDNFLTNSASLVLCFFFLFGLDNYAQFNRFVTIFVTFLLVGRYNEKSALLTNRIAVTLGDASYSIYLVHWPLFTLHRYINMDMYTNNQEADLKTGLTLISISIVAGYIVERAFSYILKRIDCWKWLIAYLLVGYWMNGLTLYQLSSRAIDLNHISSQQRTLEAANGVQHDLIKLWNRRHKLSNYTGDQVNALNAEIIQISNWVTFCDSWDTKMPTKFDLDLKTRGQGTTFTCHKKGTGTKNMVMVGNSHAAFSHAGIAHLFRDVYKQFTFFGRTSCIPAAKEFQQPERSEIVRDECIRHQNITVEALQQWNEPIDILMIFYGLVDIPDFPLPEDMKSDKFLNSMQAYYSQLNAVAKEVTIVYANYPYFTHRPPREVAQKIKLGNPLSTVGDTKEKVLESFSTIRKRLESIECTKCIKLKLIDFWCGIKNDTFCHSVQEQGIIYFADQTHPSAFGSFFAAEYMRKVYNDFVRT